MCIRDSVTPARRLLPPAAIVLGVGMVLWGIERFLDEHLWLGEDGHLGSILVQAAGIALAAAGAILLISRIGPLQRWRRGEGGDPEPTMASESDDASGSDDEAGSDDRVMADPGTGPAESGHATAAHVASSPTGPGSADPD